jgi:hypothetical protein
VKDYLVARVMDIEPFIVQSLGLVDQHMQRLKTYVDNQVANSTEVSKTYVESRLVEVEEATVHPVVETCKELREDFTAHERLYTRELGEANVEHREKFEEVNTKVDNLIKEANKEIEIAATPLPGEGGGEGSGGGGGGEAVAELLKKVQKLSKQISGNCSALDFL